jgi:hypothetical protein
MRAGGRRRAGCCLILRAERGGCCREDVRDCLRGPGGGILYLRLLFERRRRCRLGLASAQQQRCVQIAEQ